ncbi:hypothetical protein PanWU01x14_363670, partial [Parasponia andersonii]
PVLFFFSLLPGSLFLCISWPRNTGGAAAPLRPSSARTTDRRMFPAPCRSSAAPRQPPPMTGSPKNLHRSRCSRFGFLATDDDSAHHSTPNRSCWIRYVSRIIKVYIS